MTLDEAINKNIKMAELQERLLSNADDSLKEIVMKFAAEYRQLAEWLTELKEAKRLLKAAVEDFRWLESRTEDGKGHCCISGDNNELACIHCPLNQRNKDTIMCGWKHAAEALALIGEDGAENDS